MELFTLEAKLKLDTSDYKTKIKDIIEQAKTDGVSLDTALNGSTSGRGNGSTGTKTSGTTPKEEDTTPTTTVGPRSTLRDLISFEAIKQGTKAVADFATSTVSAASDLKEIQNVVDTTFETSASTIDQWAKAQAGKFGLTEMQAKQFASEYGAFFKGNYSDSETAQMSMRLAELVGDLASFRNLSIADAHADILSGMAGNTEALNRYGFAPYVGAIEEYTGIQYEKLSEAEKAKARYDFLTSETEYFRGDFWKTQDEFANSTRTFENYLKRAQVSIGERFLPTAKAGINAANSFFGALYSQSAEESLESIDETAESTAQSIGGTAEQARAMVDVLEEYGDRSALTAQQQEQWDHVANSLLRTIPELSQVLNMQTGEIIGGTSALDEHITAWEEAGKVAADTSALEAKRGYLSDLTKNITTEQAELAIAEKTLAAAQTEMIAKAQEAATATGEAFDGTAESALNMLRKGVDYYTIFGVKDIKSIVESYEEADKAVKTHQLELSSLKEDYTTVEESIATDAQQLAQTVGTMEDDVTESFKNTGVAMDTLVSDLNQGDSAYANAYNTGMGAANGLLDAYPAWAAAMSQYQFTPGSLETSEMYGPIEESDTIGGQIGSAVSSALNGAAVVMDGEKVGNLVTGTVSRNIERRAFSARYT